MNVLYLGFKVKTAINTRESLVHSNTTSNYMGDVTKANASLHYMCGQLGTTTPELFLTLFKMYSVPHPEFHIVNAEPLFKRYIPLLDQQQRQAAKLVMGLKLKS